MRNALSCIFLLTFCWFHAKGQFPDYTPKNISDVRIDYARQARYEEGITYLRKWATHEGMPKTFEDSAAWYSLQVALTYLFFDLRELDSAEVILKPILDISAEQFPIQYLMVQNGWGVRLLYGGRYIEGKQQYAMLRTLLDAKVLTVSPLQYCNVIHNLGVADSQLGDYDGALEVFHHLEDIVRENDIHDNRFIANLQVNIAGVYNDIGDKVKSLEHSQKAYAVCLKEYGYEHPFTAQILNSVANGILSNGDIEGAVEKYKEVIDIYEKIGRSDHPLRTIAMLNLAETLDKLGQPEEAMQYILPCIEIRKSAYGFRHDEVARAYTAKGRILEHLGQFDAAIASLDTALLALGYDAGSENPYSGVDAMFDLFYTLNHKAEIYYDRVLESPTKVNLLAAREAFVPGIRVMNDLRVHFKGKLTKGNLNQRSYIYYEPAIDICLQLYEKTKDIHDLAQALQWSSGSKGNDFYDLIRDQNAMMTAGVPDSVRSRDDAFQHDLATLESAWYDARNGDAQTLAEARDTLDKTKEEYHNWQHQIEETYPRYYELLFASHTLNIEERQSALRKKDAQLVEYFLGDSIAVAFILTPQALQYARLTRPSDIVSAVRQWRHDIADGTQDEQLALSHMLWAPVAPLPLSREAPRDHS